ncbi:glycosyl transferase [Izhakiella australiensis]|uniref:Glycosyl transferase n=1 Tax=Izhakiella australiensis TaxID=1926881 RepID=A0A1S8YL88_9GAMM|nr:glycosyltransferase family 8 protein [Izhakiella australiensis]OON39800.1 glycosyl transferase [Izhakiella australiensis]
MSSKDNKAWATLLTQPGYRPGVEALQRSLRRSGSRWPLVVMVTDAIDSGLRNQLEAQGCLIRQVPMVGPDPQLAHRYANARFAEVWSKLGAWNLTEFSRLVFLDADMLVVQNMDELFDLALAPDTIAACHACRCNPNRIASYPAHWQPENCYYSWCQDAAMTAHPPAKVDNYLNGGLLVLQPDAGVYQQMMGQLAAMTDISALFFAEQDFLNDFYRQRWQPLHYGYNALKTLSHQHPQMWDMQRVKNIHYIIDKPWEKYPQPGDQWFELHRLWWQIYQSSPLNDR